VWSDKRGNSKKVCFVVKKKTHALIIFILFLYPQTRAVVVVVLIGILLLSVLL